MTTLAVPCSAPYTSPAIENDDGAVIIKAGRGAKEETSMVHAPSLLKCAEYFRDKLHDFDPTDSPCTFAFSSLDPSLVEIFVQFVHTGSLDRDEQDTYPRSYRNLFGLYLLASQWGSDALRNAALDAFFLRIYKKPGTIPYEMVPDLYKETSRKSALRELVLAAAVHVGRERDMGKAPWATPREFWLDCLRVGRVEGVVKVAERDEAVWLEGMRKDFCRRFHYHDDVESEVSSGVGEEESDVASGGEEDDGGEMEVEEEEKGEKSEEGPSIDMFVGTETQCGVEGPPGTLLGLDEGVVGSSRLLDQA